MIPEVVRNPTFSHIGCFPDAIGHHFGRFRRTAAQKQMKWCEALSLNFAYYGPSGKPILKRVFMYKPMIFIKSTGNCQKMVNKSRLGIVRNVEEIQIELVNSSLS